MSKLKNKKVSVVGLGYIGLPTAAMFALQKIEVVGIDVNQVVVDTINQGNIHIIEPDLDVAVRSVVNEGFLRATTTPEYAEAFIIAVPTPLKGKNHEPDLSFIEAASKLIAPVLQPGNLVILESTVPIGGTEKMLNWLKDARPDLKFPMTLEEDTEIHIAHCPERVLPGKVMIELITNDRIIGGMTSKCSDRAISLYKMFVKGECIKASCPRTAEMTKLSENSFRDVNIAFANELSLICDEQNINVWEIIHLANRHPRVGILLPGPGVGGHCIAVDPWFIVDSAPQTAQLIKTSRLINNSKPEWVIKKILSRIEVIANHHYNKRQCDVSIAIYGISFKPDIDDLRESPALGVFLNLSNIHDGPIIIVEPNIQSLPTGLEHIELSNIKNSIEADLHVILVRHSAFTDISFLDKEVLDFVGLLSHVNKNKICL